MEQGGRQVEKHETDGEYRAAPEVLRAFARPGGLRHENYRPDDRQHKAQSVRTGVQHLAA